MKFFSGDLEETVAELEMCRRKLAALRTQKETAVVAPSTTGATLGVKIEGSERVGGPEKISKENREFEAALEEAKVQTFAKVFVVLLIPIIMVWLSIRSTCFAFANDKERCLNNQVQACMSFMSLCKSLWCPMGNLTYCGSLLLYSCHFCEMDMTSLQVEC